MGGVPGGDGTLLLSVLAFCLLLWTFGRRDWLCSSHGCQSQLGSLTCSGKNDRAQSIFCMT